jgi:CHAT domain-containing protein
MQAFYDALAGGASRVGALHAAQRALRERTQPWGPSEALALVRGGPETKACGARRGVVECAPSAKDVAPNHPYYWAAFTLTGDPRPLSRADGGTR